MSAWISGWLRQRHRAAPELVLAAHVHIVLAHEVKLAIGTGSVNRKSRGKRLDGGAVAHRERDLARGDQHTSGRIEPEGAQRDAATVDVPNQGRLAGRLVDRERRDAVLAARKYLLAFELHRGGGAVGKIERAAVGVHVDRPGALACRRLGVGERLLDEDGLTGEAGRRIAPVDVKLILALDRHVDPGLGGVEVEMPRAEMHAVAR